jgi:hypothetical protein
VFSLMTACYPEGYAVNHRTRAWRNWQTRRA